jgi:hypothetical protein
MCTLPYITSMQNLSFTTEAALETDVLWYTLLRKQSTLLLACYTV